MINFSQFQNDIKISSVAHLSQNLVSLVKEKLNQYTHGELDQWQLLIDQLPALKTTFVDLKNGLTIGLKDDLEQQLNPTQINQLIEQLKTLHPWRKGPYDFFGIHIDTEWRSDWKWDRLLPHISSLENKTVLDVGCGNGYHCWKIHAEGAKFVLGIDPAQKFLAQFSIFKKYLPNYPVHLLPLGIEDLNNAALNNQYTTTHPSTGFDTVFSMGVLYHRKSPMDHLLELKNLLTHQGELVLETLVIDGDENQLLIPKGRYAQMRNVWFIPSAKALELWLAKCGYSHIRCVDINQTSVQEQRATDWMHFHSLSNYLDPNDPNRTIEGYPAPKRVIIIANNG